MKLIKHIKDAEQQAKDIVEGAGRDAGSILEEAKKHRDDLLRQSHQRRSKAIDDAVGQAEQEGKLQAEDILQAGTQTISTLKESSSAKIKMCVEKVLSRLQQAL